MSSTTTETTADTTSSDKNEETNDTSTASTTSTPNNKQTDNKSMKKVRSKKDLKNDPSRFESPGVNFNAKLIGIDEVTSARGDKMCQESIQRLKLAVKTSGQHKQKIIVNVSLEGVRLIDLRSQAVNHTHLVHRISFISRDITDSRAFGYVYGAGEGKHKFFAIKTEKAAEALVLTLRDLFQVVYDLKKKEVEEAKHKQEESIENAEEAKDSNEEPVYQVPKNGAPVENPEDPTYQVPKNNAPVDKKEDNLLNLESELESIEQGIEQMNDLEDMFSDLRAPATTSQSPSTAWGDELHSTLAQPPASTQPAFTVGGTPFPAATTTVPPAGSAMFGQPFPAPGASPAGFGNQPWGQAGPQPGMAPAAFPGATPNPFGVSSMPYSGEDRFDAPNVPPRTVPGAVLPPPVGHPHPHAGHPHPGGFPPTPFPGPGQINRPNFPPGQPQNAPGPAPANDPFGNDPFAMGDSGGFGDNLLTPDKIEVPQEEPQQPESQGRKDAFGDLVDIGAKDKQNKSPKQMFVELAAPPKKSLNELKVEKAPSPKPASPVGFQASETSEAAVQGSSPTPADISTLDQFGTKDPFGPGDSFGSSDPFASSFPANLSQSNNTPAQVKESIAPNVTIAQSQNSLFGGSIFDDDFNLPAPTGAPPPLPTSLGSVSTSALNIPPPPPRTVKSIPPNTQNTPPLPPRPTSVSASLTGSKDNASSGATIVHVPQIPPLPPRLNKPDSSGNNCSVTSSSLSKEVAKEKENSSDMMINNSENELPVESTKFSDEIKIIKDKQDNTQTNVVSSDLDIQTSINKSEVIKVSFNENCFTEEKVDKGDLANVSNEGSKSLQTALSESEFSKARPDKNESTGTIPSESNSNLSSVVSDSEMNVRNLIKNKTNENLKHITSDNGANCDTDRISVTNASDSHKGTTNYKVQTDTSVNKTVDHNSNKTSVSSVSDPFVSIDPFASDDPFAQSDPFSTDPFASDPFSDSVSITSVSSTSSNDPFTSACTSQKPSHTSVDASDDPFSVFDNSFEPFHFEKSKKSKVKLKFQGGQ